MFFCHTVTVAFISKSDKINMIINFLQWQSHIIWESVMSGWNSSGVILWQQQNENCLSVLSSVCLSVCLVSGYLSVWSSITFRNTSPLSSIVYPLSSSRTSFVLPLMWIRSAVDKIPGQVNETRILFRRHECSGAQKGLSSPVWATLRPWVGTLSCWPSLPSSTNPIGGTLKNSEHENQMS